MTTLRMEKAYKIRPLDVLICGIQRRGAPSHITLPSIQAMRRASNINRIERISTWQTKHRNPLSSSSTHGG